MNSWRTDGGGADGWTLSKVREVSSLRHSEVDMDALRRHIQEALVEPPRKPLVTDREPNEIGEWKCTICGEYKDVGEYHRSSSVNSGRQASCKACKKKRLRDTTLREWLSRALRLKYLKSRAGSGVHVRELLQMLEEQGGRCYYSHVPLTWPQGGNVAWNMRLERLDRTQGWSAENCALVAREFCTRVFGPKRSEAQGSAQWSQDKVEQIWGALS